MITCLGWGPKRPDWMKVSTVYGGMDRLQTANTDFQEKKNVDAYKASIKAQLSRAGLIRGQPRHNPLLVPSQREKGRPHGSQQNASSSNDSRSHHSRSHHSFPVSIAGLAAYAPYQPLVEPPFMQPTNGDDLMPSILQKEG